MNQSDYRYRWRFTRRALCLFDADTLVGELVRLEGGEWALFAYLSGACSHRGRGMGPLGDLVPWAEEQLWAVGALPEGASIDRFGDGPAKFTPIDLHAAYSRIVVTYDAAENCVRVGMVTLG